MGAELRRIFGEYTLVDKLGVGGTATVYLGRKRLHDGFEWVALKCLHPHLAEIEEIVRMFMLEAEILSRLHHPNVCEMLRYGSEAGIPFIATRYLRGASLDVLWKKLDGRSPPATLLSWVIAEACAGLHHAHEARNEEGAHLGLVHRDVSPHNIFVTFDGGVRLLDFGVARAAIHTHFTQTGELKGKDGYMSPEQINSGSLDRRSDVFSMGIVLWEAITGQRLYQRSNQLATALAISEEVAPDPRAVNESISESLATITLRALALEPEARFSTAAELEHALRAELADDLSPRIQAQILMRGLLAVDGDHDTDMELTAPEPREPSEDLLDDPWLDATATGGGDDETEVGRRYEGPLTDLDEDVGDSTTKLPVFHPPPEDRDGDDTVSVVGERVGPADTVSVQTPAVRPGDVDDTTPPPPPPTPARKGRWRTALLIGLLVTLGVAWVVLGDVS